MELRRFVLYILPVVVYAGVIFFLSSQPTLPAPGINHFDKVAHFSVYAGLAFLAARGMRGYGPELRSAAIFGAVLAALYGVSDEIHQSFVPGRSADVWDVLADTLGGAAGAFVWLLIAKRRKNR